MRRLNEVIDLNLRSDGLVGICILTVIKDGGFTAVSSNLQERGVCQWVTSQNAVIATLCTVNTHLSCFLVFIC